MKSLDERLADDAEKPSLGLLLGAFVNDVHAGARVLFAATSVLAGVVIVPMSDSNGKRGGMTNLEVVVLLAMTKTHLAVLCIDTQHLKRRDHKE